MNNFEVVVGPQNPNHLGDIRQANIRCHAVGISEVRFRDYCLPNSILNVLPSSSMLAYRLVHTLALMHKGEMQERESYIVKSDS